MHEPYDTIPDNKSFVPSQYRPCFLFFSLRFPCWSPAQEEKRVGGPQAADLSSGFEGPSATATEKNNCVQFEVNFCYLFGASSAPLK